MNPRDLENDLDELFMELSKKQLYEKDNKKMLAEVSKDIMSAVKPMLEEVAKNNRLTKSELKELLGEMKFDIPKIDSPQFDNDGLKETIQSSISEAFSQLKFPEPKVNIPPTIFPPFPKIPKPKDLPSPLPVKLTGLLNKYPVPVLLVDDKGNPYTAQSVGRGGGGHGPTEINNISTLSGDSILDSVNKAMRVSIVSGSLTLSYDQNSGPAGPSTLRVVQAVDVGVSVNVIGFTASVATVPGNAAGTPYDSGFGLPISLSSLIDSNIGPSGAQTLRVTMATDAESSVQTHALSMTTNPTAVGDATDVTLKADKLGRLLSTPVQVRQLRTTAYATLNSNGETTLRTGISATFLDLIFIKFANTSTGAVTVDLRSGTGGSVLDTFALPGNAVQGIAIPVPYPQTELAQAWTIQFNPTFSSDISNTTVYASALFSQEL